MSSNWSMSSLALIIFNSLCVGMCTQIEYDRQFFPTNFYEKWSKRLDFMSLLFFFNFMNNNFLEFDCAILYLSLSYKLDNLRYIGHTPFHPLYYIFLFFCRGRAGLFTPFIYYQFLKMRLSSRRNPSTRNVFHELRSALANVSTKPAVPGIIKWLINGLLSVTRQMTMNPVEQ